MAADHGSVVGYQRNEKGQVVPILNGQVNEKAAAWGLSVHQAAVVDLAVRLSKLFIDKPKLSGDFCLAVCHLFQSAFRKPTREEASCWGRMQFSTDQTESVFRCMIPASRYFQRVLYAWMPRWRPEAWWIEGATKFTLVYPCRSI